MKKILSLLLTIISLTVVICSCGQVINPVETQTDTNGEIITTTTTAKQTTSNNSGKETTASTDNHPETTIAIETTTTTQKPNEPQDDKYLFRRGYPANSLFWETPSRIIIAKSSQLLYFSKATKEILPLCFDPLCVHPAAPALCFSYKFAEIGLTGGMQNLEYCAYNNRIYALRGEQLFSFKFDGSDLKLEYSFGEEGKEFGYVNIYMGVTEVKYLHVYGQYVFMLHKNASTGNQELMRYDTKTSKMENMSEKANISNHNIDGYIIGYDRMYISIFNNETKEFSLLSASLALDDVKKVQGNIYYTLNGGIFDGEKLYVISGQIQEKTFVGHVYAIDMRTNLSEQIMDINGKSAHKLFAVTDRYIYYAPYEQKEMGYETIKDRKQYYYSTYTKIHRMDKITREDTIVYSEDTLDIISIFISGDEVFVNGQKYIKGNGNAKVIGVSLYVADIDDNGNFVNMHELEIDIDE